MRSDLERAIDQLAWEVVNGPLEGQADARGLLRDAEEDLARLIGDEAATDFVDGQLLFHDLIMGPG